MPQGHPDYRFICQEMWRRIQEVHPALAEAGKFVITSYSIHYTKLYDISPVVPQR